MEELPRKPTSSQPLPPIIKKPKAYAETQSADLTQFLKGNATLPDSNSSQGPAALVPENNSSQEPAANTEETSQATNPGEDGELGNETNC